MAYRPQHIAYLVFSRMAGQLTAPEAQELEQWIAASPQHAALVAEIENEPLFAERLRRQSPDAFIPVSQRMLERINADIRKMEGAGDRDSVLVAGDNQYANRGPRMPVHRVHGLQRTWIKYAAAAILLLGIGAYLWNYSLQQKEKPSVTQTDPRPMNNDVAPGGNKALLTLSDGSTIVLDSAATGTIATQHGARVIKRTDGQVIYEKGTDQPGAAVALNTMSTPRGGQYQLTLPDGSRVWLNAASSITYPTVFTGKVRKISITGEAYFEVAKDKTKPFLVDIGAATIEVLGTHFNVNAYKEEPKIHTTLIEGSVRIKTVHTSLTLKPGQQGQLTHEQLSLAVPPDIAQVMAWKNGLFDFNGADLPTVMKQLERWYDVTVVYEDPAPAMTFGGKMQRSLHLSEVTGALSAVGVKFRIEGRNLIVSK